MVTKPNTLKVGGSKLRAYVPTFAAMMPVSAALGSLSPAAPLLKGKAGEAEYRLKNRKAGFANKLAASVDQPAKVTRKTAMARVSAQRYPRLRAVGKSGEPYRQTDADPSCERPSFSQPNSDFFRFRQTYTKVCRKT